MTDPQSLLDDAECYNCYAANPQMLLLMELALLAQIVAAGGGGAGGLAWSSGSGSPEGVVTGSPGDRWWDNDTGNEYVKVTGTATTTGWAIH